MKLPAMIAAVLAAAALYYAWHLGDDAVGLDFYHFRAGARIAPGSENFYSRENREAQWRAFAERAQQGPSEKLRLVAGSRTEFEFTATPFLFTVFAPFRDSYERDLLAYRVVSMAAFVSGVLLLARALGIGWTGALLILAFTLTLFQPLKSELRVVNVNSLQLFAIALAMWLIRGAERWRMLAGGAVLGAVTAFKPNLIFLVPLLFAYRLIARDRVRLLWETAGAAAGALFAVLVSSAYFGSFEPWLQWPLNARDLYLGPRLPNAGNIAPFLGVTMKYGPAFTYVVAVLLVGVVSWALWRRRHRTDDDVTPFVVALALMIYLISAALVWLHYLILALPAAIALIADRTSEGRRLLGATGLSLIGFDIWMHLAGVDTLDGQSRVLWFGLAMLFVASLWRVWEIRTVAPGAASQRADDRRRSRTRPRPPRSKR